MEQMIAEYEAARSALEKRINELTYRIKTEELMSRDREQLLNRIEILRQERYELLLCIIAMRGRGGCEHAH